MTPGTSGVQVWFAIDNDVYELWWNGVLVNPSPLTHENCATYDSFGLGIPASSVLADNVVAIRARDRGIESFVDVQIVTGGVAVEPAPDGTLRLENGATGGDPVQTFHGLFGYSHTDVAIPGRGPAIAFTRSYSSADTRTGPMGPGWTHSYNARIRDPGDGSGDLLLVRADGGTDRFHRNNNETFSPDPAVASSLVRNGDDSYTVTERDQTRWEFDPSGRLVAIADRYGNASTLAYDASGQLSAISDPAGRGSLALSYTNGLLTAVTDWASPARTVTYQYDGSGRLWKVTDREGNTTTYGYDGTSARITTITDARGHVALTLTYDAQGRVATQKDSRGLTTGDETTFAYLINGDGTRITTVTYPTTSFEPTFHPTLVDTYNASGWLTQRVSHPSSTETLTEAYGYGATGFRTSVTDARGSTTDFCYDVSYAGSPISGSRGNLTRRIDPPPTTGANRPVTLLAYDARNNLVQAVAPKGVPSGTTVTCSTNLAAVNAAYALDLAYDASGTALLSVTSRFTDPDAGAQTAVTKYEYGDAANPGLPTRIIPPRGNTGASPDYSYATSIAYFTTGSKAGMLASTTDALGNTTTYDYDAIGRLVSSVDPNGNATGGVPADHRTDYVYDREDRLRFVKLPAPASGGSQPVTETRYDGVGNPIVRIDANGQITAYAYDERDGLSGVTESPVAWTDPASPPAITITTTYAYDAAGYLSRMTRASGDAANERGTDYTQDGRGLTRSETQYPSWPSLSGSLVTTATYDPSGAIATVLDPLGHTTSYAYDALGRLTSVDYSDPATPDVAYGYDANGNRTAMTDGTGSTGYTYDEANRLSVATSPGPKTVGYRYDLDGNRTKLIYPDGTAVTYAFNKGQQLAVLTDWANRSVSYAYWPDGAVRTVTNPDASVASYGYDNTRRLTGIANVAGTATISQQRYTLDPLGNVTAVQEQVAGLTAAGGGWTTTTRVNTDDGTDQNQPAMAMGADGTASVIWSHDLSAQSDIYFAELDASSGSWSAQERVNDVTTGNQFEPAVAVDSAGNADAIWTDERASGDRNIYFAKRSAATGTWSPSVRVNDDPANKTPEQRMPAIAVGASGEAIAVWVDKRGNKNNIYAARLPAGGSTWSANMKVTTNTSTTKSSPAVSIGPDGTAYAVWYEPASGDANIWFASLAPGATTWSANEKISDDPGTSFQGDPKIGVDGTGNVIAVWDDWRTTPLEIRARVRPAGSGTWSSSVVVSSDGNEPSLSVRADGHAYVAWYDGVNSSYSVVWGADYDPATGTWSTPERISDPSATDSNTSPAVALGSSALVVAWVHSHDLPGGGVRFDIVAKARTDGGTGPDTFTYGYDALGRLTSAGGPDGDHSYAYDPVGNRTGVTVNGVGMTATFDRADRITASGGTPITVNATGNLTARGADSFAYDAANRLISATVGGSGETYAYDGDGVRTSRTAGANPPIGYVSDVNRDLPVTLDDGTRKYVWGLGLAYAVSGSSVEVYHADRLGSVRAVTDGSGSVVASYRTDAWGNPTSQTGSSTQPFGFTGEPVDASGLVYLRARYYDPGLGRFMTRDAWAGAARAPQTTNQYAYGLNSPSTRTDPTGRCPIVAITLAFAGGAVFGGVGAVPAAAGGATVGFALCLAEIAGEIVAADTVTGGAVSDTVHQIIDQPSGGAIPVIPPPRFQPATGPAPLPPAPPAGGDPFNLKPFGAIVMAVLTVIAPLFAGVNDLGEPATIPTTGPARSVR